MLNEVTLIGQLGKDPEVTTMKNGKVMAKFSLATTKKWRNQDGEKKEATQWHNIVVWSEGLAKTIGQYAQKGSRLYVKGELQTRKYQDKSGKDCYSTEVVLSDMNHTILLLDTKLKTDSGYQKPQQQIQKPVQQYDLDDEIPFD